MLVVQDVCVIPTEGATRLRHHDVVVVGDRVISVQTTGGLFPGCATIVDARRMFLVSALLQQRLLAKLRAADVAIWCGGELLDPEPDGEAIEPGVRADLVLLGGDPFEDVRNVAQLEGVVTHGTWHGREALEWREQALGRSALPLAVVAAR